MCAAAGEMPKANKPDLQRMYAVPFLQLPTLSSTTSVIPAQAGISDEYLLEIPACAGMTVQNLHTIK
jgi:hypothetical protein